MKLALVIAVAAVLGGCRDRRPAPAPLVLPAARGLEARFTGGALAAHRPLHASAVEAIPLAALAALEQRGPADELIAALASAGDRARARAISLGLAVSANNESDRAALALADGDAERALVHAYRALDHAPTLGAAWWNLGLAARDRGLLRVSRAAFARVAALNEAGWAEEARAQIAARSAALAPRDEAAAFDARGRAMVDGGALIDVADVARFPAFARVYALDALRLAAAPERLRPLARALDALSKSSAMDAAVDRAVAGAAQRARFVDAYRKVVARTATPAELAKLIDALRAAGPAVDDLRVGAIITGGQAAARVDELAAIVAPWRDPWFELVVARARIQRAYPAGDLRGQPSLVAALAQDPGDAYALRAGQLAQDLAQLLDDSGRGPDAERWSARAVDWFARAVSPTHLETARADLGSLHRNLGRTALARAELEEVVLAVGETNCHLHRFASIALADLALGAAAWDRVRAALPPATPPPGCAEALVQQGIGTATDLARQTGDPRDRAAAEQWIADARASQRPDRDGTAIVAAARLARGRDPAATKALSDWLAEHPPTGAAERIATRTWGYTTLVSDAGAARDWRGVLDIAAREHAATASAPCAVIASLDDGVLTVVARAPAGVQGLQRRLAPTEVESAEIVPPVIRRALAGCASIAVDARPPLHGRADLLPLEQPWWFASNAPVRAPVAGTSAAASLHVAEPRPSDPSLPALPVAAPPATSFARQLRGDAATPEAVLAALGDAGYAELHVHGIAAAHSEDAAFLALSPERDGTFALTAERVRHAKLAGAPLVVLAACRAAQVAAYLRERWSLPDAFVAAGASAVVAADVAIPNASAQPLFDELHRAIAGGQSVEAAVAAMRARARPDTLWSSRLMVFR